jgi:hypothetical protein
VASSVSLIPWHVGRVLPRPPVGLPADQPDPAGSGSHSWQITKQQRRQRSTLRRGAMRPPQTGLVGGPQGSCSLGQRTSEGRSVESMEWFRSGPGTGQHREYPFWGWRSKSVGTKRAWKKKQQRDTLARY